MMFLFRSIGAGIAILTVALAGADFYFKERHRLPESPENSGYETIPEESVPSPTVISGTGAASSPGTAMEQSSLPSSSTRAVKKGTSTRKRSSVNVEEVITKLGLVPTETTELSLLSFAATEGEASTKVLLRDDDRAFLFSWIEHDDVKSIFYGLKKALQEQFSTELTGLVDETKTSSDGPPVDILSFTDPAISKEKIVFLRVRNRLYELHVAENGAEILDQLISELGK